MLTRLLIGVRNLFIGGSELSFVMQINELINDYSCFIN